MPEEALTRSQVQDVIDFAAGLRLVDMDGQFFSPFMSNTLLKDLTNNPRVPTEDRIKKALIAYKESGDDLRGYAEFCENIDMLFKRTLYAYVNSLAFDLEYIPTNCYANDFQSSEYQEDKKIIAKFLNAFKYKKEFRDVAFNVMRSGRYFTWFRKTKWGNKGQMKYALQIMPQSSEWVMPTGYFDQGFLWSMNMMYFIGQTGVDIDGYDPSLKRTLARTMEQNGISYVPSADLNDRNGVYNLWADVSPNDGAWMFAFNPTDFSEVPFLAPFVKDILRNDEIAALQVNKDMIGAYGILAGELRLFDNAKSGTQANQFAIDPKQVGAFLQKAKSALGNVCRTVAMPVENVKFHQYDDKNPNMYVNSVATTAGVGSSIGRIVYSSDRVSNAELEAQLNEVYQTMRPLYRQFENFLNFYINKNAKLHFNWRFLFDGSNYAFERNDRFDRLLKIADKGLVLPPHSWASALGIEPQVFDTMLDESKNTSWLIEYTQMMANTNTKSAGDAGGRPRMDDGDITDSAENSRNQ